MPHWLFAKCIYDSFLIDIKLSESKFHNDFNAVFRQVSQSFFFSQMENVISTIFYCINIYYLWLKLNVRIGQFNIFLCIQLSSVVLYQLMIKNLILLFVCIITQKNVIIKIEVGRDCCLLLCTVTLVNVKEND